MIILEALTNGEKQLRQAFDGAPGYHQPKIDAQLLLSKALGKPTAFLFSHIDYKLTDQESSTYEHFLRRREAMEPVAYITGTKWFYSREFNVNEHTLIPRPDTEVLVEDALKHISMNSLVVDVGTGSGAIGISVAAESKVPVVCIDISQEALVIARKNAKELKTDALTHFLNGNLIEPLFKEGESYYEFPQALILANLPYISDTQYGLLEKGVKDFEPRSALISGPDGLDHYRELFKQIQQYRHKLPNKIRLYCEIDSTQRRNIIELAKQHHVRSFEILKDLERRDRIAVFEL